jgi:hypothetical protein
MYAHAHTHILARSFLRALSIQSEVKSAVQEAIKNVLNADKQLTHSAMQAFASSSRSSVCALEIFFFLSHALSFGIYLHLNLYLCLI